MKAETLKAERPVHEHATPEGLLLSMNDADLAAFVAAAQAEIAAREKRRKEEAIAKIRELAGAAGLSVAIEGARGRPGGKNTKKKPTVGDAGRVAT